MVSELWIEILNLYISSYRYPGTLAPHSLDTFRRQMLHRPQLVWLTCYFRALRHFAQVSLGLVPRISDRAPTAPVWRVLNVCVCSCYVNCQMSNLDDSNRCCRCAMCCFRTRTCAGVVESEFACVGYCFISNTSHTNRYYGRVIII